MISGFITYIKDIKGYSLNTAVAYEKDLRAFAKYLASHKEGARWSTVTLADVDTFIINQSNRGLKPATLCREISSISAFYKYLKREGYEVTNPVKYECRPKIAERIPHTIEKGKLLQALHKSTGELHTILTLLWYTGIRIQECLDITWEDIKWQERKIIIHGKGGKDRQVYMNDDLVKIMQAASKDKRWRIFPTWTQERVRREMYEIAREMPSLKHFSPHTIRHTYATSMAAQGANVAQLATLLGHKSIKTTQKYIDMSNVGTEQLALSFNPLNN